MEEKYSTEVEDKKWSNLVAADKAALGEAKVAEGKKSAVFGASVSLTFITFWKHRYFFTVQ